MNNKKIAKKLNKIAKELLSVDFPNQKAMNDYLKQHPLADRKNHKVIEFKPKQTSNERYNELVLNPIENEQELQKLVDEKAKEMGYNSDETLYHGTSEKIEVFDERFAGDNTCNNYHGAFYFSNDKDIADDYSKQSFIRKYDGYDLEDLESENKFNEEQIENIIDDIDFEAEQHIQTISTYVKMKKPYIMDMNGETMPVVEVQGIINAIKNNDYSEAETFYSTMLDNIIYDDEDIEKYSEEIGERAMENYGLDDVDEVEDYMFNQAMTEILDEHDAINYPEYDGIIVKNTVDDISESSAFSADVHIVLDASTIKKADPITYNNDGQIISLDDRFSDNENINY